jgi:hypothetical protein
VDASAEARRDTAGVGLVLVVAADCEQASSGSWLAQPVNAWSSLAFMIAGAWIVLRAHRGLHGRAPELTVFGIAVASNALGGFLYHGTPAPVGHRAHDVAIYAVLAFVAAHDWGIARERSRAQVFAAYVSVLSIAAVSRAAIPGSTDAIAAVLVIAAAAGEVVALGKGLRPRPRDGLTLRLASWLLAIVAVVAGIVSFALGTSGSPLCHPASAFQWHALWHVLQALAMVGYAYAAVELWSPALSQETAARLHG